MFTSENVLVPIDGSPQAEAALAYALGLPAANITLLTIIDPFDISPKKTGYQSPIGRAGMPGYTEEWYEPAKAKARGRFAEAQESADAHGISLSAAIEFGDPARSIIQYADKHGIDHIVMGNHGRTGLSRVLFGSVSETVVRRSAVPVTIIRGHQTRTDTDRKVPYKL